MRNKQTKREALRSNSPPMNTFTTAVILRLQNFMRRHSPGGSKVGSRKCGEFKSRSPHRSRRRNVLCSSPRHPWAASARTRIFLSQIDQQGSLFCVLFSFLFPFAMATGSFYFSVKSFCQYARMQEFSRDPARPLVRLPCSGIHSLLYLDSRVQWDCVERKSYLLTGTSVSFLLRHPGQG